MNEFWASVFQNDNTVKVTDNIAGYLMNQSLLLFKSGLDKTSFLLAYSQMSVKEVEEELNKTTLVELANTMYFPELSSYCFFRINEEDGGCWVEFYARPIELSEQTSESVTKDQAKIAVALYPIFQKAYQEVSKFTVGAGNTDMIVPEEVLH